MSSFWVEKNIETLIRIENYLTNYFMNSNIDFQSVCLGTILYSSTEITDFSWQLYFFLVNFKSEIWQIYVIRRHHCQSTRGSCLPLLIFSYKGISILYYSMRIRQKIKNRIWYLFLIFGLDSVGTNFFKIHEGAKMTIFKKVINEIFL